MANLALTPQFPASCLRCKRSARSATKRLPFTMASQIMQPLGCVLYWRISPMPFTPSVPDRIEKNIELKAPIARVWRALTDHREFGEWFRVKLDGPFVPGEISRGHITYPGYEHMKWEAVVQKMEPERLFSFTWHPYGVDPNVDYSRETPTLVE